MYMDVCNIIAKYNISNQINLILLYIILYYYIIYTIIQKYSPLFIILLSFINLNSITYNIHASSNSYILNYLSPLYQLKIHPFK